MRDVRIAVAAGAAGLALGAVVAGASTGGGALATTAPNGIDAGTRTCTTDSAGFCANQRHGLGSMPVSVVVTAKAAIGGSGVVENLDADSFTATTFRIRAFKPNGSALAGTRITYSYAAFSGPAPAPPTAPPTAPTSPASPSASVSPTVTSQAGFPDASTTGVPAGTTLRPHTGNLTVSTAGTVIDGWSLTNGCITVNTTGVIIKNSRLSSACSYVVYTHTGSLTIQDSEIDCANTSGTAIGDTNVTAVRVDVSGCENGFDLDRDSTVQDSYIHGLFQSVESHTDGIQTCCSVGLTVRHNRIDAYPNATSAMINAKTATSPHDVLIENNLLAGGAFTLYCPASATGQNFQVIDNRFSTRFYSKVGVYGPWTDCESETLRGNTFYETGQPVPPQ